LILISLIQFGTVDYATGLRLQQQLVALRKEEKIGDILLLLEHAPVITLGRNAKATNVIASPELLTQRGVELFECDRGGDVTFHGPGQIVGYPIFDLRGFSAHLSSRASRSESDGESRDLVFPARKHLGAVDFVRRLEEVLIRTCADFAISAKRVPGLTGVWTDPTPLSSRAEEDDSRANRAPESRDLLSADAAIAENEETSTAVRRSLPTTPANSRSLDYEGRSATGSPFSARDDRSEGEQLQTVQRSRNEAKLAAIGVHISRFVTSHGFALNVNTDLSYFDLIVPCGITAKPVTSMQQQLGREVDLNAVAESISRNFGVVFQTQILWVDTLDALLGRTVGVPMKPPTELRQFHKEDDTTWA
jgi:lipoate-protein ligase B